jgi:hypothetical protein
MGMGGLLSQLGSPMGIFQILMNLPSVLGAAKSMQDADAWKKKWGEQTQPERYAQSGWAFSEDQRKQQMTMPSRVDTGINDFLSGLRNPSQGDVRNALAGKYV